MVAHWPLEQEGGGLNAQVRETRSPRCSPGTPTALVTTPLTP